ncbi:MAG: flavin reductase family protein [Bdellovibrionota bacterium]
MNKMIEVDVSKIQMLDAYKLLIGTVVPRPIAWVGSIGKSGSVNLAPFSFFTAVCSNPPSLLFCPANHPDGKEKDTLRNIRETRCFTVNLANEALAREMNQTAANYPPEVNEFKEAGLTAAPSRKIKAPRVGESPASFECELLDVVAVGPGGSGSGHIVLGKVVYAHYSEQVYEDGKIKIEELKPIARLGGTSYCRVNDIFELARPKLGPTS